MELNGEYVLVQVNYSQGRGTVIKVYGIISSIEKLGNSDIDVVIKAKGCRKRKFGYNFSLEEGRQGEMFYLGDKNMDEQFYVCNKSELDGIVKMGGINGKGRELALSDVLMASINIFPKFQTRN